MKLFVYGCVAAMCWSSFSVAAEPSSDATEEASAVSESVMGKALPDLAEIPEVEQVSDTLTYEEYKNRPYDNRAYRGAEMLDMEPAFMHGIQVGIEKVYFRDYSGARAHFKELEAAYPGTAIAPVADTLIWQAIMLENFDFSKEDQYWKSTERATESLEQALKTEGNQAIEHFLMAGIQGVESIHMMRKFQFIPALQRAFSAMGNIEECREIAPDFVDLKFADGMYHYWRTVVTTIPGVMTMGIFGVPLTGADMHSGTGPDDSAARSVMPPFPIAMTREGNRTPTAPWRLPRGKRRECSPLHGRIHRRVRWEVPSAVLAGHRRGSQGESLRKF